MQTCSKLICNEVDMTYKAWQKNYANRHQEQLIMIVTICNKAIPVPDLVKNKNSRAETDIN